MSHDRFRFSSHRYNRFRPLSRFEFDEKRVGRNETPALDLSLSPGSKTICDTCHREYDVPPPHLSVRASERVFLDEMPSCPHCVGTMAENLLRAVFG